MPLTTDDILIAWNSVTDRWISRRNKTYNDGRQYEVIHDWGGDAIGDAKMKVVGRYENHEHACERATHLEGHARAQAVLDRINREERRPR